MKKLSKLQLAQRDTEYAVKRTNFEIDKLGNYTGDLYESLVNIQLLFDRIRNMSEENMLEYEKLKRIRVEWKEQVEKIEIEYKKSETKAAGNGVAGVGAGVAVAALGPTAAMGIATTFGVASTGTAISSLGGAAATNAALAWLGGGALAAGGGGMAAGNALLAFAGPVGWTIAGVSIVASGLMFFKSKNDKERLENIYTLISERDTESYQLAIVEINERIKRIIDETKKIEEAMDRIKTFGTDYNKMSQAQQYGLGAYFNLMKASTKLLVNPILGLQPKYTEQDFKEFSSIKDEKLSFIEDKAYKKKLLNNKNMIITMANLLYKINLDDKDKKLLVKSLNKNKDFIESMKLPEGKLNDANIVMVQSALDYKYKHSKY